MEELTVDIPANGSKNAVIKVAGMLTVDISRQLLVSFSELRCKKLKVESVTFALQEKLGLYLWWEMEGDKHPVPLLPLESRGYLNWSAVHSLHSPEGASGILIETFNCVGPKMLVFELDLEKQ